MPAHSRHALALDFGCVLTLDPDRSAFEHLIARAGLDPEAFHRAYGSARQGYDRGTLDAWQYWTQVLQACRPGMSDQEIGPLVPSFIDADFHSWARPRSELHELIQRALAEGVPTAIVSNMPRGVGERFLATWPWLAGMDHHFFSANFGLTKPQDTFYRHVLGQTGWVASEVLFVDDLPANIEAARRWGFQTLLFSGSHDDLQTIRRWCGLAKAPAVLDTGPSAGP